MNVKQYIITRLNNLKKLITGWLKSKLGIKSPSDMLKNIKKD